MDQHKLADIAIRLTRDGRGILAMDESTPTCNKRFEAAGIETTEQNRRAYRELLVSGEDLGESVSGAILYDETIRQRTSTGLPFPEFMAARGIATGIKVDTGARPLAGHEGELVTEGLDGLRQRLDDYAELGAEFAKWRAVIAIADGKPTHACIEANTHALARYAALCQEAGLVPIVEPEVLMDGSHDIDSCHKATMIVLSSVFDQLRTHGVMLEGIILKPNMVISGLDAQNRAGPREVAERTLACLRDEVPTEVAGVAFLSGGQSDIEATVHLDLMNRLAPDLPWPLTFSFGRALQRQALEIWKGQAEQTKPALAALVQRAHLNSLAAQGIYPAHMEHRDQ